MVRVGRVGINHVRAIQLEKSWWQHRSLPAACFGSNPEWSLPFGIVGTSKLSLLCSQGSSASCMAMGPRNVSAVVLRLSETDCCTDLQRRCAPQISSSGMWRVAAAWL